MTPPTTTDGRRGIGLLDAFVLTASVGLVAWGGVYLGHFGGRFAGDEFDAVPTQRVVSMGPPAAPESPEFKRGKQIYFASCSACHGAKGEGIESNGFPPLDKSEWVTSPGTGRLIRILLHALEGPIKVAGKEYNNSGMLAWGEQFSSDEIAAVATYIRQAWSNKASTVSADEVNAVREATKGRATKWTAAELEKIPDAVAGAPGGELTAEQLKAKLRALPPEALQELLKSLGK